MGNFNRGGRDNDRRGGGGFGRRDSGRDFNRGGGGFSRPAMHKAVCDACHKNCEVPFKPTGDKPIYCSDCFSKQGGGNDRPRFGGGDRDRKPRFDAGGSDNSKEILKGIKTLNYKLDELMKALGKQSPVEDTITELKQGLEVTTKSSSKKSAKKSAKKVTSKKKVIKKKKK